MKTSYRDFILHYLRFAFKETMKNGVYGDKLLRIETNPHRQEVANADQDVDGWSLSNFAKYIDAPISKIKNYFDHYVDVHAYEFIFYENSDLIKILITKCDEYKWVDIEHEYYLLLCKLSSHQKQEEISELNEQFEYLQRILQDYLRQTEKKFIDEGSEYFFKTDLTEQLTERINITDRHAADEIKVSTSTFPESILILNFNYTVTIADYLNKIREKVQDTKLINIHGNLDDEKNPIIFGYGDEEETNYATLEKYDECLRFVKTYRYSRTHNYQQFIDFVSAGTFEVYVAGHSCGLSDKTLLSEVFNNRNCTKIKLLTYNKKQDPIIKIESTDYIEKTYQIGRVFKEKSEMRRKLIPFSSADILAIRSKQ